MTTDAWGDRVLSRFGAAAGRYDSASMLQRAVAWRLAGHCRRVGVPKGLWVDLGSGTGNLADALESHHPGQQVLRLDGSDAMLRQQPPSVRTQLWDLRQPLPSWELSPSLLASSFCLHWLDCPEQRVKQWLNRLQSGGWLALALPVEGCFPQWHQASAQSGIACSALAFPHHASLCGDLESKHLQFTQQLHFTTSAINLPQLLKPLRRVGAGSSRTQALPVQDWRALQRCWPDRDDDRRLRLTWVIQLLLIRR
ncbi:MAG: methyltransferase [Cyanobacteriota bacterium]|nr:methyltransferase [Cyanobacteriota bacterium]